MTDSTGNTGAVRLVRPTAGQLDVWSRVAGLGVPVGLVVGLGLSMVLGITGAPSTAMLAVFVIGPAVVSTILGFRAVSTAKQEKAAGYSTMFDFAGYELRDPRTLNVVRERDVKPTGTLHRSLFRSMLTVKPGTLLAKRLEEDDADR
ncbi:MAG: hypothetical protein Q8M65_04755 [Rhodoglobus sp.]|nr:hypothetical protein [Rhodoglobus sp.]